MTGRPPAEIEVQRILALVPWVAAHPGSAKSEIAERFGVTEEQLERDLGLVLMIGVPPYSPGEYIDVDYESETVTITLHDYFRRPLRLTPSEGLALLAAGRALLAVPGSDDNGPLAGALDKLERTLGLPEVGVDVPAPAALTEVRAATVAHEQIEIEYWSAGRDETTTRRVDPAAVFFAAGEWYLAAWCHRAEADRLFRVDRIRALRSTGEVFDPGEGPVDPGEVYKPRESDPRVVLDLPPSARWIPERYPAESISEVGDRLRATVTVSEPAWLQRLLLRAGPDARVIGPPEWIDAGSDAATRVLSRYRGGSPTSNSPGRR